MKNLNQIATLLKVDPRNIKLAGEISPNFNINSGSRYWSEMGESYEKIEVFSLSANGEWREIETDCSYSSGSGERYEAPKLPIKKVLKGNETNIAVVTKTCDGTWKDDVEYDIIISLYTVPRIK